MDNTSPWAINKQQGEAKMAEESHAERPKSSSKKRFSFVSSSSRVHPVVEGSSSDAFPSESTTELKEADDDVTALQTTKKGSTKRRLRSAPLQGLKRKMKETSAHESVDSSCSTSPTPPSRGSTADSGWHESEKADSELSAANLTSATVRVSTLHGHFSTVTVWLIAHCATCNVEDTIPLATVVAKIRCLQSSECC